METLTSGAFPTIWDNPGRPNFTNLSGFLIEDESLDGKASSIVSAIQDLQIQKLKNSHTSVRGVKTDDKYKLPELKKMALTIGVAPLSMKKGQLVEAMLDVIGRYRDLSEPDEPKVKVTSVNLTRLLPATTLKRIKITNVKAYSATDLKELAIMLGITRAGQRDQLAVRIANKVYHTEDKYDAFVTKGLVKEKLTTLSKKTIDLDFYSKLLTDEIRLSYKSKAAKDANTNDSLKTLSALLKDIFPQLDKFLFVGRIATNEKKTTTGILAEMIKEALDTVGYADDNAPDWPEGRENYVGIMQDIEDTAIALNK